MLKDTRPSVSAVEAKSAALQLHSFGVALEAVLAYVSLVIRPQLGQWGSLLKLCLYKFMDLLPA